MLIYDRQAYEELRDGILSFLKGIKKMSKIKLILVVIALATTACYNAAMMRVSGESRDTCQNDSDCAEEYMCVRNISPNSTLGECVHENDYDPWANRRLEDIIKLENKKKKSNDDRPEAKNPDTRWWLAPEKGEKPN